MYGFDKHYVGHQHEIIQNFIFYVKNEILLYYEL